jgi:molybdopterin molybdotransferase
MGESMTNANAAGDCTASGAVSVDAARLRALAAVRPVAETEVLTLAAAHRRVSADVGTARIDLPPFDNSAMDGYALRLADLAGDGPWVLPVTGRIAAGETRSAVLPAGAAMRIFTGAPIPAGADAVVIQEAVIRSGDSVALSARPAAGANIRRRGEDCAQGRVPLAHGLVLTAPRLALLAATGIGRVSALRPLRVALFSTGNELREPGDLLAHGQIYNSNRVMLRALMAEPWITLDDLGILPDDPQAIRATIRRAAATADAIISSGGVSVGEEDHILDALRREAATIDVLKVAIRPGKPLTVGRVGRALYVGLPGNPYAAAITFTQIARPALRRMAGITEEADLWLPAVSGFQYDRRAGRTEYVPVTWHHRDSLGRPVLERLGRGASASLSPIAAARGIAVLPSEAVHITPGMALAVEPIPE